MDTQDVAVVPPSHRVGIDGQPRTSGAWCGCVRFWRQFYALERKNFLSKRRSPVQLIVELVVPPLFLLLLGVIKESIDAETVSEFVPSEDSPVASFGMLETSTSFPNALCFDDNLLHTCQCSNEDFDDQIEFYMTPGTLSDTGRAIWSTAHAGETFYTMCGVVMSKTGDCTAAKVNHFLCGMEVENLDTLCGPGTSDLDPSPEDLADIMDMGIAISAENGFPLSIPESDIESTCQMNFLAVMPSDDGTASAESEAFLSYVQTTYPGVANHWVGLASESDLMLRVEKDGYSRDRDQDVFSAGVVFQSGAPNWEYTIRTNRTRAGSEFNIPTTSRNLDNKCKDPEDCSEADPAFEHYPWGRTYISSGILTLQNLVDSFILHQSTGGSMDAPTVRVADFPHPEYAENGFWSQIGTFFSVLMVISVMYPVSNVINALVKEKELRIKEGLKMMGLTDTAHTASWVFHFFCTFLAITILMILASGTLLENSDSSIVFYYFFFFFLSTMSYCFFVSAFFSKARTAATLGTMAFFVALFPFFAVSSNDTAPANRRAACLLPPTCLALGTIAFTEFEDSGEGVTAETSGQSESGFTFNDVVRMLFIDIFVFGVLSWYAGKVIPSEWGTQEKPWFLFTRAYWFPKAVTRADLESNRDLLAHDESENNNAVEGVAQSLRAQISNGECVAIRGLTKTYKMASGGSKVAVDNLDLTMYSGQITALLGHNGAGKTTTIGMLTGMTPVTSGTAYVAGLNVRGDMRDIRQSLGVCPQHDILYPDLTVQEHLRMYAVLKGVPSKELKAATEATINDVGLTEKRNERIKRLSGGQKRKLSVGIALIGGSKVIFLDEPTSGMDPHSRRFTWDLIRKNRNGRTIVLTTHFMDEADLLGDRIAIMADGVLKCCGSSLFLKNHYGVGYNMTIVRDIPPVTKSMAKRVDLHQDTNEKFNMIEEVVERYIPSATLLSNVGAEISFQLPSNTSGTFRTLLSEMEAGKDRMGISSYGMSVTTLEEVFLRVANGTVDAQDRKQIASLKETQRQRSQSSSIGETIKDVSLKGKDNRDESRKSGSSLFLSHVRALTLKRYQAFSREKKMWAYTIFAPVLFVLVGIIILLSTTTADQPSILLTPEVFNEGVSSPFLFTTECLGNNADGISSCDASSLVAEMDTDVVTPISFTLDETVEDGGVYQLNKEILARKSVSQLSHYGAASFRDADTTNGTFDYTIHLNYTALHAAPIYLNQLNAALLRVSTGIDSFTITTSLHPFPWTKYERSLSQGADSFLVVVFIMLAFSFIPAAWVSFVVREREHKNKHQQVVSGVSLNAYWLSSFNWDFISFLIPAAITLVILAAADIRPLVGQSAILATLLLLLMYSFSMPAFTYITSFAFKSHTSAQNALLFFNWIIGVMAPTAVLILAFFESLKPIADGLGWFLRILPHFALGQGLLNLGFRTIIDIVNERTEPYDALDGPIAGYSVAYMAIEAVLYTTLLLIIERMTAGGSKVSAFCNNLALKRQIDQLTPQQLGDYDEIDEDVTVEAQRVQAGQADDDVVKVSNLRKIYPSSKGVKLAVKSTSLGIPRGECFGLLGINGAGKSSTLAMLSGEIPATSGEAFLAGYNVSTNPEDIHRLVGYCPQFDALFATLTAREHLRLYAAIKGIPASQVESAVDEKIHEMGLTQYADRLAGGFSGGNKRKLSVAIAMIGDPQIVFLDEPSTGMDPMARRFMWDVITRIVTENKECAMILTTHSMEECEALCQRIGIMVGGRIRCLGSSQHLKTRFGKGYQLEVSVSPNTPQAVQRVLSSITTGRVTPGALGSPLFSEDLIGPALNACGYPELSSEITTDGRGAGLYHILATKGAIPAYDLASWVLQEAKCSQVMDFLQSNVKGLVMREKQNAKMRFAFPPQEGMTLGDLFGLIEDHRSDLEIGEYSLSQTSLEQIFNGFASEQEEEEGHAAGMQRA